jgi:hypothetical protein
MYTRNYFDGGEGAVPRAYDGIARRDEPCAEPSCCQEHLPEKQKEGTGFLQNILGNLNIRMPSLDKIGFEEILIIAIAAFLFFSADGDRECALILLALLLIN